MGEEPDIWQERLEQLAVPHMQPLTAFVERLRETREEAVPYPDPYDGGTEARVLLLLEAPGRRAVTSGFVSVDNPDGTARNLRGILGEVALERDSLIVWNIIPWYIGTQKKIRAATRQDVRAGLRHLGDFLNLLPDLGIVVMMGRKAQQAKRFLDSSYPDLALLETFHPSNQALTFDKTRRVHIAETLSEAKERLNDTQSVSSDSPVQ